MRASKIAKALLFPHMAVPVVLLPVAGALLGAVALRGETDSAFAIAAYVVSAYTLTIWCLRLPRLIRGVRRFREENRYVRRWQSDVRLRVGSSLVGSLIWNTLYALLQLWLGVTNGSAWFYSLAVYYLSLAVMRLFLMLHTRAYRPGERMRAELVRYRACGWIFLIMNLAISGMVLLMVWGGRTFEHDEIVTIAMAAYTFGSFTTAIISIVRYRRYNSPIYSATKAIKLAAACVSMLTLEATMLTTFGGDTAEDMLMRRAMLGLSGGAVAIFIVLMAIYMIAQGTRRLRALNEEEQNGK